MSIRCRSGLSCRATSKSPVRRQDARRACGGPAWLAGLTVLLLLGLVPSAWSQPLPLPQEMQNQVNKAIDWGVDFLLKNQQANGAWGAHHEGYVVGYTALPGLTLLECGVPPSHPVIQRAAALIRQIEATPKHEVHLTYDLALSVLFLDKLGDPKDRPLIRTFILRLMAGQTATGGWDYVCPVLSRTEQLVFLRLLTPNSRGSNLSLTPLLLRLPVLQPPGPLPLLDPPGRTHDPVSGTTDNSNTQFALLAMWAARRYDMPMERTLNLLATRFRSSQNADGSWGYLYKYGGNEPERKPMTCVGLLGLAVGHGLANATGPSKLDPGRTPFQLTLFPRHVAVLFYATDELAKLAKKLAAPAQPTKPQDPQILKGLVAMSKHVGRPAGRTDNLPLENLYYLWSVERVSVLYGLRTIGDKDWYRWGAEMLVANQQINGSWKDGGYYRRDAADRHLPGAAVPQAGEPGGGPDQSLAVRPRRVEHVHHGQDAFGAGGVFQHQGAGRVPGDAGPDDGRGDFQAQSTRQHVGGRDRAGAGGGSTLKALALAAGRARPAAAAGQRLPAVPLLQSQGPGRAAEGQAPQEAPQRHPAGGGRGLSPRGMRGFEW